MPGLNKSIPWEVRHMEFMLQRLAEFDSLQECTDAMLKEFYLEWGLTPEDKERLLLVRRVVYDRVKYYNQHPKASAFQQRILERRRQWLERVQDYVPEANKERRIRFLANVAKQAFSEKEYASAIRAMEAIREETTGSVVRLAGKITHEHRALTDAERDRDFVSALGGIGLPANVALAVLANIRNGKGGGKDNGRGTAPKVEDKPAGLLRGEVGGQEGDD